MRPINRKMFEKLSDFNSRTSCEVRPNNKYNKFYQKYFNSRTSCEVRHIKPMGRMGMDYFNSRTSCEVRPKTQLGNFNKKAISTHAPLARCDQNNRPYHWQKISFQLTHLLRGATEYLKNTKILSTFQLTHLLRGATAKIADFSPYAYTYNQEADRV